MFRSFLTAGGPSALQRVPRPLFFGLLFALLLVLVGNRSAYAQGQPGGNVSDPVVQAVDLARPAAVRIYTSLPGHLTVHFSNGDVTFPQDTTTSYTLTLSGSGTFISANGDILTADHVVNPPKDAQLSHSLHQTVAADVAKYINQNAKAVGLSQMTDAQVGQALDTAQLRSDASYDTAKSEVFLSTDYTGPLTATTMNQVPAQLHAPVDKIEAQSAADAKDVAIVHAGFTDTPSVILGDSSSVQVQDALKIIGFPGNGDINDIPTNLLTPSISDINVSSIKTTTSGASVIQVSGNVGPGDSGGPALNASGNVVGIVSFGTVDTNGSSTGTSFLQTSNSASELLKTLTLDTTPGSFQKLWSQAFASYVAATPGHWHTAQQQFQQLVTQYPNFKAVQPYLDYTKTQAQSESGVQATPTASATARPATPAPATKTTTQAKVPALMLTIGAVAVLVLLSMLFLAINIRGRRKNGKKGAPQVDASQQSQVGKDVRSTPPIAQGQPNNALPTVPQKAVSSPPSLPIAPQAGGPLKGSTSSTLTLRPWACGHMNRSNARFCSICGEPAAAPTTVIRRVEQ